MSDSKDVSPIFKIRESSGNLANVGLRSAMSGDFSDTMNFSAAISDTIHSTYPNAEILSESSSSPQQDFKQLGICERSNLSTKMSYGINKKSETSPIHDNGDYIFENDLFQSEVKRLQGLLRQEQRKSAQSKSLMEEELFFLRNERLIIQRDILTLKSELENSKLKADSLERETIYKTEQCDKLKKQLDAGVSGWESKLSSLSDSESYLRAELKRAEGTISSLKDSLNKYELETIKLMQELSTAKANAERYKKEVDSSGMYQNDAFHAEYKRLQILLHNEQESASRRVGELEEELIGLRNERLVVQRELLGLKSDLEISRIREAALKQDLTTKTTEMTSEIAHQRLQWESLQADLETKISSLLVSESKLKDDVHKLRTTVSELTQKLNSSTDEEIRLRNELMVSKRAELEGKTHIQSIYSERMNVMEDEIRRLQSTLHQTEERSSTSTSDFESKIHVLIEEKSDLYHDTLTMRAETDRLRILAESTAEELRVKNIQFEQQKSQWYALRLELESENSNLISVSSKSRLDNRQHEDTISELSMKNEALAKDLVSKDLTINRYREQQSSDAISLQTLESKLAALNAKMFSLNSENSSHQREILELREELEQSKSEGKVVRHELSLKAQQLDQQRQQYESVKSNLEAGLSVSSEVENKLRGEVRKYEMTISDLHERIRHLEENLRRAREDADTARHAALSTFAEIEFRNIISNLSKQNESTEDEVRSLRGHVTKLKEELVEVQFSSRTHEDRVNDLQEEKLFLERSLANFTSECEMYRCRAESLEEDLTQKQQEHERQRRLQESNRASLEAQLNLAQETEMRLRKELRRAEQTVDDLQTRNQELETAHRSVILRKENEQTSPLRFMKDAQRQQALLEEEIQVLIKGKLDQQKREIASKADLSGQLQELQMKYNASQAEASSLKTELESVRGRADHLTDEALKGKHDQAAQLRAADSSKALLESQIARLTESETRLRTENFKVNQNQETLQYKLQEQAKRIEELQEDLSMLRRFEAETKASGSPKKYELEIQSLRNDLLYVRNQLLEEQSVSVRLQREVDVVTRSGSSREQNLLRELEVCRGELAAANARVVQLDEDIKCLVLTNEAQRAQETSHAISSHLHDNRLQNELESMRLLNADLKEKNRRDEADLEALRSEVVIYRKAYERAIEEMRTLTFSRSPESVSERQRREGLQSVADAKEAVRESDVRMEAVRAENLQAQKTITALRGELDAVKNKITSLERSDIDRQSKRNLEALRLETEEKAAQFRDREVQLQNDLKKQIDLYNDVTLQLEKARSTESQLRAKVKELSSTRSSDDVLSEHRLKWDDQRQMLQKEIQRQSNEIQTLQDSLSKSRRSNHELEQRIEKLRCEHKTQISAFDSNFDQLKRQLEKLEELNQSLKHDTRRSQMSPSSAEHDRQMDHLEDEIRHLRDALTASQGRHNEDLAAARKTETVLRNTISRVEEDKLDLESRLSSLQTRVMQHGHVASESEVNHLRSEIFRLEDVIQVQRKEIRELQQHVDRSTEQKASLITDYEDQITRLESELRNALIKVATPSSSTSESANHDIERLYSKHEKRDMDSFSSFRRREVQRSVVSSKVVSTTSNQRIKEASPTVSFRASGSAVGGRAQSTPKPLGSILR